ncbi:MAG: MBL fold metallo-hydrolase [Acidimicrobiales bacterium]
MTTPATTLTVLGCDGSHAGAGGAGSGYLVRAWDSATNVWLDSGPGTFANLQRYTDPLQLTGIVLTHEHDDHWSDLQGFITACKWTMRFERDPVPVLAAPGIKERVSQDFGDVLDWHEVEDGEEAVLGGVHLRFSRTDHPPVTFGVRLQSAAGVLGYSADSGAGWPLAALGTDLDLALCEATYTDDLEQEQGIHMTGTQAGRSAAEAGAKRLILTHRWHTVTAAAVQAEAARAFGGPIASAEIGRGFSL